MDKDAIIIELKSVTSRIHPVQIAALRDQSDQPAGHHSHEQASSYISVPACHVIKTGKIRFYLVRF
jgi:hypothetical protein